MNKDLWLDGIMERIGVIEESNSKKVFSFEVKNYDGTVLTRLNENLIKQQNLSSKQIEEVCRLHRMKHSIILAMKDASASNDVNLLRYCAERITDIEFMLQRAWGFTENINYHMFWLLPGCSCPTIDNMDAYPSGYYVTASDCLIHGEKK